VASMRFALFCKFYGRKSKMVRGILHEKNEVGGNFSTLKLVFEVKVVSSSSALCSEATNASSKAAYCSSIITNHLKLCKSTQLIK
jgi:hypothetical protein